MTLTGQTFLRALSLNEQRVLVLVCAGLPNRPIAERIDTTEQVVKNLMRGILRKAGRQSRSELLLFVFRNGVVDCPCKRQNALRANEAAMAPPRANEEQGAYTAR